MCPCRAYVCRRYSYGTPDSFWCMHGRRKRVSAFEWCQGEEAKEILPSMPIDQQYHFGEKAGEILRQMLSIEAHALSNKWAEIYGQKVQHYLANYRKFGAKLFGETLLLDYLDRHQTLLNNRPMHLLHGNYQTDNMVIFENRLSILGFQGSGLVDSYYTLTGAMVSAETSPAFATGQLHRYFGAKIPQDFWALNAFYLAAESLNAFTVAVALGEEEVAFCQQMSQKMLSWFDDFRRLEPDWFLEF
ncbi:phosphotransferase [Avibacterium sp. 21-595]|uniref:phosphotransferase n=1 Tax=Avibacterium sp. 21-595 TaxID=2911527 RepID=UPI002E12D695